MTFLDFFAGIGTIRIGFEQAGWICNGHVEWDKFAQASYNAMHDIKDGEFCGWDIREVRADELPRSDLWTFGAPCQDFSIAGKRNGMDGERSSLVNEIFRLIEETPEENRPAWLLYENVKGMLSSNGGWDFLGILLEMDRLGYDVEWQLLNSKHFGVPQNRERVFTLGHLRGRGGRKIFPIGEEHGIPDQERMETTTCISSLTATDYKGPSKQRSNLVIPTMQEPSGIKVVARLNLPGKDQCNRIYSADHLSPSLTTMQGGRQEPKIAIPCHGNPPKVIDALYNNRPPSEYEDAAPTLRSDRHGLMACHNFRIRKLTPKECWRLQGIPDHYFYKASAVNSDSQLYKQAGNACTVNVMYEIAKRMGYD